MGNDASKAAEQALRDDSDFQEVSLPSSSPRGSPVHSHNSNDLSYSGVMVERPVVMALDGSGMVEVAMPTPPALSGAAKAPGGGGGSSSSTGGSHKKVGGGGGPKRGSSATEIANRRIVKATPPPSGDVAAAAVAATPAGDDDDGEGRGSSTLSSPGAAHKKQHLPAVFSPKADSDLLEESIEHSRNRRMEKLSREQKSKRDKAIDDKRRKVKPPATADPTPQPNPFSKFLSAFSVKASHPKRAYELGESDRDDVAAGESSGETAVAAGGAAAAASAVTSSKRPKLEEGGAAIGAGAASRTGGSSDPPPTTLASLLAEPLAEWLPMATAAAGMAIVAVWFALRLTGGAAGSARS